MKTIFKKTVKIAKGKQGKYGVARTENKILEPFIGQEVTIVVKQ